MKKRIFGVFILIALLVAAFSFAACNDKGESNEDLTVTDCVFSSFTAQDFDGNIIDETVFAGYKITMINVWATYCTPCKSELPDLAELNTEYNSAGFQVIGIPADGNTQVEAARQIIEETNANFTHLRVSASLNSFIGNIKVVPYTLFVNENGEQIGKAYSGTKSKSNWKTLITQLLQFTNE